MAITTELKNLLLGEAFGDASEWIKTNYGEDASSELFQMVFSSMTEEEFNAALEARKTVDAIYNRRMYEMHRFRYEKDFLNDLWPEGTPPVVERENISMAVLQAGMFSRWVLTIPDKTEYLEKEGKTDEEYERVKDLHDYLYGYVNREALEDPVIDWRELAKEFKKQREVISNYIGIVVRRLGK